MQNKAQLILKKNYACSPGVNSKFGKKTLTWALFDIQIEA